jgi:hypothetical protein
MPQKLNGHDQPVKDPHIDTDMQLAAGILHALKGAWLAHLKESGAAQVRHARLTVVAATQLAAIIGVDVGMTADQFTNVCKANFDEAYKRAPKFG